MSCGYQFEMRVANDGKPECYKVAKLLNEQVCSLFTLKQKHPFLAAKELRGGSSPKIIFVKNEPIFSRMKLRSTQTSPR